MFLLGRYVLCLALLSASIYANASGCSFYIRGAALNNLPTDTAENVKAVSESFYPPAFSDFFSRLLFRSHLPIKGKGSVLAIWKKLNSADVPTDASGFELWSFQLEDSGDSRAEYQAVSPAGIVTAGGAFWQNGTGYYSSDVIGDAFVTYNGDSVSVRLKFDAVGIYMINPDVKEKLSLHENLTIPVISAVDLPQYEKRCLNIMDSPRWD